MKMIISVSKKIEQGEFAGMYKSINKKFIIESKRKNVTEKLKDEVIQVIKSRGLMVRKESINKYNILKSYEIYESGALSYDTGNSGGVVQDYEFIKLDKIQ